MTILKVNGKEYKIKFGYRALAKSKILKQVMGMQKEIKEKENEAVMDNISEIFELLSNLVLAGLQKYNPEFKCDYDSPSSVTENMEKIYDLLDDYMDDEESESVLDLFGELVTELIDNGFLSKKSETAEAALIQQDATVVPADHQKKQN